MQHVPVGYVPLCVSL